MESNYLPSDYFERTPSTNTNCDYNYYSNYVISTPTLHVQQTHPQQPQTQSTHQQSPNQPQQIQLQQSTQLPQQTPQQQTQGTTGLIDHHGHHINQQVYHASQQPQHHQQLHQPATYLDTTLQDYGYNQVTGTDLPTSVTISTGNYNNYGDCSGVTNINTLNYQVVDTIIPNQCNDNQYNQGNYGDSTQLNYGYIDSGLAGVNTNFSTHVPNAKSGQNQLLIVKEEGSSTTSTTSLIINSTKEDSKPVKPIRKKKANRKKEPNNNKKSPSGYAHFFRELQARIKKDKTVSFGEISKIVASQWDALSIDEKAVYKKKAENTKNDQFKDIALSHAMAVAGANLSNNNSEDQMGLSNEETRIGENDNVQGNIGSMINYQQTQQQQHHHQQQQQQQQLAHLIHPNHQQQQHQPQQQQHLEANYNHGQINYPANGGLSYS